MHLIRARGEDGDLLSNKIVSTEDISNLQKIQGEKPSPIKVYVAWDENTACLLRDKQKSDLKSYFLTSRKFTAITSQKIKDEVESLLDDVLKNEDFIYFLNTFKRDLGIGGVHLYRRTQNMILFSLIMAVIIKAPREKIIEAGIAAAASDLGLTRLRDLLEKPELTKDDWKRIEEHPLISSEIVSALNLTDRVLKGIEQHHERLDGSGYPHKLKAEQITPLARMLGIIDSFIGLTGVRGYRKGKREIYSALQKLGNSVHKEERYDKNWFNVLVKLYGYNELLDPEYNEIMEGILRECPEGCAVFSPSPDDDRPEVVKCKNNIINCSMESDEFTSTMLGGHKQKCFYLSSKYQQFIRKYEKKLDPNEYLSTYDGGNA
jgi:hypothetical protein